MPLRPSKLGALSRHGFALCVFLALAGCTHGVPPSAPLTGSDLKVAVERGARFLSVKDYADPASPLYRTDHINEPKPPRIHLRHNLSLFVLSGEVVVLVNGTRHNLSAGDSLEIAAGAWYSTQNEEHSPTSLFFAFDPAARPATLASRR